MCFNVGVIIGPIFGGMLADPLKSYPHLFGPGTVLGGKDGVWWMERWPFALPNVLSAIFIFVSMIAVLLGLDEVSEARMLWIFVMLIPVNRRMSLRGIEATGVESWVARWRSRCLDGGLVGIIVR